MSAEEQTDVGDVLWREDTGDPLGGAANEQQRHGGEHAEQDGDGAQLAGSTDGKIQPPHQDSAQDGAQHCHRDPDSS